MKSTVPGATNGRIHGSAIMLTRGQLGFKGEGTVIRNDTGDGRPQEKTT